ncbi:MAG: hypothetical protein EHM43_13210 [Ignavibacteriae bacterium]|nr:MAG: hypothetical protein EHM43_13210 [Ignavibacteriota bacterium]
MMAILSSLSYSVTIDDSYMRSLADTTCDAHCGSPFTCIQSRTRVVGATLRLNARPSTVIFQ